MEDGTFIRIQTVSLGYTIPLRKSLKFMDSIRIYTNVDNLFTFTKFKGYDPEVASGTDSGAYPSSRSFIFGVNVTL